MYTQSPSERAPVGHLGERPNLLDAAVAVGRHDEHPTGNSRPALGTPREKATLRLWARPGVSFSSRPSRVPRSPVAAGGPLLTTATPASSSAELPTMRPQGGARSPQTPRHHASTLGEPYCRCFATAAPTAIAPWSHYRAAWGSTPSSKASPRAPRAAPQRLPVPTWPTRLLPKAVQPQMKAGRHVQSVTFALRARAAPARRSSNPRGRGKGAREGGAIRRLLHGVACMEDDVGDLPERRARSSRGESTCWGCS